MEAAPHCELGPLESAHRCLDDYFPSSVLCEPLVALGAGTNISRIIGCWPLPCLGLDGGQRRIIQVRLMLGVSRKRRGGVLRTTRAVFRLAHVPAPQLKAPGLGHVPAKPRCAAFEFWWLGCARPSNQIKKRIQGKLTPTTREQPNDHRRHDPNPTRNREQEPEPNEPEPNQPNQTQPKPPTEPNPTNPNRTKPKPKPPPTKPRTGPT